jgi:uncharacterized protein YkwD
MRSRFGCGGGRERRRAPWAAAMALAVVAPLASPYQRWAGAEVGGPSNDEIALLVLANQARSDPGALGYGDPVVPPMLWNDDLAAAARAHSEDMASNGCFQHNSCNGRSWSARIGSYYHGWTCLAENVAAVLDTPESLHAGWMGSAGHRANILSGAFTEFGAGLAVGATSFGPRTFSTEDFGSRGLLSQRTMPAIPAAAVLPRIAGGGARQLVANFYHYGGDAPRSVSARLGGACIPLRLVSGHANHGTYAAGRTVSGSGCTPLVFEAVRADGQRARFPTSGAILVGAGGESCPERSDTLPTAICPGGAEAPPPADPLPSGPTEGELSRARLVLRARGPGKDQVIIEAILPAGAGFDPSGSAVGLEISSATGQVWAKTLPAACRRGPCIVPTNRGNGYRSRLDAKQIGLSLVRTTGGDWRLRFWALREDVGEVAPGPLQVAVFAPGLAARANLMARPRQRALVAE